MDSFASVVAALHQAGVRFVVIGVAGANYHALPHQTLFATQDRDLLLPLDAANELACLRACLACGLELTSAGEPLGSPIDLWLAERIVERRATVRAESRSGLQVDVSLVMAGFDFEEVWDRRAAFVVDGVSIPVASLEQIVASKRAAGRDKDLLFLEQHRDLLEDILRRDRHR